MLFNIIKNKKQKILYNFLNSPPALTSSCEVHAWTLNTIHANSHYYVKSLNEIICEKQLILKKINQ